MLDPGAAKTAMQCSSASRSTPTDDSKTLVTGSADTTCKMWDTETGVCYFTHQFEQPVRAVALANSEGVSSVEHESRNGVSLDAPARVIVREGGAAHGGNSGQPRVGTRGGASEDAAARLSAGARFPPVQRHEHMTQIPGARRTTSEYQGHSSWTRP